MWFYAMLIIAFLYDYYDDDDDDDDDDDTSECLHWLIAGGFCIGAEETPGVWRSARVRADLYHQTARRERHFRAGNLLYQ